MMMLVEVASIASNLLPLAELREQVRLPSGFPDDGSYDPKLEASLRAALAAVEARTAKAVFQRQFRWQIAPWRDARAQSLPIAPVETIDAVSRVNADGVAEAVAPESYRLVPDTHGPALAARGAALPMPEHGGHIEILFTAGYGADWLSIPADLREAVLILAAELFDQPAAADRPGTKITGAAELLLAPYRALGLRRARR